MVDGLVMRLVVVDGGSDYSSAPAISFSGGNCSLLPQANATLMKELEAELGPGVRGARRAAASQRE